jgi:hypothetical protein
VTKCKLIGITVTYGNYFHAGIRNGLSCKDIVIYFIQLRILILFSCLLFVVYLMTLSVAQNVISLASMVRMINENELEMILTL